MPLMPKLDFLSNVLLTMFDLMRDTLGFIKVNPAASVRISH